MEVKHNISGAKGKSIAAHNSTISTSVRPWASQELTQEL